MSRQARRLSGKAIKRLAHSGIRTRTSSGQAYKERHAVGGEVPGLHIQVTPGGAKQWFLRTTVGRKPHPTIPGRWLPVRREFGLGGYPTISLQAARQRAKALRAKLTLGIAPKLQRHALVVRRQTFAECEAATIDAKAPGCKHPLKVAAEWRTRMDVYVNPVLGHRRIDELTAADVAAVLQPLWRTKYHTAKKIREDLAAVFRYAKAMQLRNGENPTSREALEPLLGKPRYRGKHRPSLPYPRVPGFMEALRTCLGDAARALEFAILTAARSNEVRGAEWPEFDLENRLWTVPAERSKCGREHRVPLSSQAAALLEGQRQSMKNSLCSVSTLVFANRRGGPLSHSVLGQWIKRMHAFDVRLGGAGYLDPDYRTVAVPHGFRSSFKDWARNSTHYADEVSELALAHVGNDATRAAYARDALLGLRTPLMQAWADFCDGN
ncbi:MAG: tyrosine-type recombinase/integrase [Pseudoxanthomonas sp.]